MWQVLIRQTQTATETTECFTTNYLTRKNKALDDQLRLAAAGREFGRRDTVSALHESGKCLALADSIIRHVGTESSDMMAECFAGIRTKQRRRVTDNRDLS